MLCGNVDTTVMPPDNWVEVTCVGGGILGSSIRIENNYLVFCGIEVYIDEVPGIIATSDLVLNL